MARISRDQQLANLHAEALAEFDNIQSALRDERLPVPAGPSLLQPGRQPVGRPTLGQSTRTSRSSR